MDRTFAAAPVDDVQLQRQARPWLSGLEGRIAQRELLAELTRDHGTDLAATVFYQSICAHTVHGPFIAAVDSQPLRDHRTKSGIKLLVVPAFLYREYPTLGGDGKHILGVARALGLDAELVATESTGSVLKNAEILQQAVAACDAEEIWLLSMSKGGAEVRLLFQQDSERHALDRITHWFNVSGLARGSQLVDELTRSTLRRARLRAMCLATGARFDALRELRTDNPLWQAAFEPPVTLRVTNIFGVPLSSHVERALVTRYQRIRDLGPNDGMVLLHDAIIEPGLVYPIWGTDHYMRDARIIPTLYRLMTYFLEHRHSRKEEQPPKGDQ